MEAPQVHIGSGCLCNPPLGPCGWFSEVVLTKPPLPEGHLAAFVQSAEWIEELSMGEDLVTILNDDTIQLLISTTSEVQDL